MGRGTIDPEPLTPPQAQPTTTGEVSHQSQEQHDEEFVQLAIAALTVSAIYLYAWPAANLFYAAAVLFHVGLGVAFCVAGLFLLRDALRGPALVKLGLWFLLPDRSSVSHLSIPARRTSHWNLMYAHIVVSAIAVVLLAAWFFSRRQVPARNLWESTAGVLAVAVIVSVGAVLRARLMEQAVRHQEPCHGAAVHGR